MDFTTISDSVGSFFNALPPIFGAFLTFVAGYLLARFARFLAPKLLAVLRFDLVSEKTGITGFLKKGNVHYTPSKLVGILLYWFLMILVLSETVSRLDKGAATSISIWISSALPIFIAAAIIVVIGVVVVTFLSNFFITIARNAAVHNPVLIGKAIKYVGFIVVATMALEQLGLGQTIVSTIFILLFAAAAFGLALAFGLGCKDMAKKFMEDFIRNIQEKGRIKHGTDLEG
ncbi:MAG TPA: hypothetical protein VN445_09490 [Rectinemataceae bacterium]|nr:hypothetical protein [Rectinemataceae bacterium]